MAPALLALESTALRDKVCAPLGLNPSEQQLALLLGYLDLLSRWNATYNLTAVKDRAGMLTQHLADCLAVVPAVQRYLGARDVSSFRILDVGSGGGLPGIVLAIMLPTVQVSCVDSVGKKAAFVRQVAGALALPRLQAVHSRVEALKAPPFDLVISRAFASLPDFVGLTASQLASDGCWLAMKGKYPQDEIEQLPAAVQLFHVEQLMVPGMEAERCLLWLKRAQQTLAP